MLHVDSSTSHADARNNTDELQDPMRVLLAAAASSALLSMFVYLALSLDGIQGALAAIASQIEPQKTVVEVVMEPTKVTRSKTVDGTLHSVTWCYAPGGEESWAEFLERVNREWAAYCESIGG